jgi:hypothetical protein
MCSDSEAWHTRLANGQTAAISAKYLIRIDGHKEPEKLKTEEGIEA